MFVPSLSTATHTLQYFYTGVSGGINFPEFTAVGLVDNDQFMYFDSNTMKAVPKTDWIKEGPNYWKDETDILINKRWVLKNNIDVAQSRFSHSSGMLIMNAHTNIHTSSFLKLTYSLQTHGYYDVFKAICHFY